MSITTHTLSPEDARSAKQLTQLLNIVKAFGWDSLVDVRVIKPNMRAAQLYLRKHVKMLTELFPDEQIAWTTVTKQDVVDKINPLLIRMWHVHIIGDPKAASLELLITAR